EGDDCVAVKVTGSGKFEPGVPTAFALDQNYPNPFNPTTSIAFSIPVESQVEVVIYNTMGQVISRLASGILAAGSHSLSWSGTDDQGRAVPSGTYLYRLTAGDFVQTRSMLLLK
ncbi:MAG TPA: FlgD immunoglobulin-like domain containing protein, partial [Rhodothermia bacterium]|nr:FlgD immunoglobulin-like domain containing protein [Rhodothermia bacterium]